MDGKGGHEYFWLCKRAMADYPWLSIDEEKEVLAESVFWCCTLPYELSYALARWAVRYAIQKHCIYHPLYRPTSIHRLHEKSWPVYQPELKESNIIDLNTFRKSKKLSHSPCSPRQ